MSFSLLLDENSVLRAFFSLCERSAWPEISSSTPRRSIVEGAMKSLGTAVGVKTWARVLSPIRAS